MFKPTLEISIGSVELRNPIILASGVCGFGESNVFVLNKCGAVVFKTVTLNPREGNPSPRAVDFPFGMLNSIGLENPGVDGIKDKVKYIRKIKCKKIASLLGYTAEEFVVVLDKLERYNLFDAYELNLSCPNVEKGEWFYSVKVLKSMLVRIRSLTKKTLIAKLSPEVDVISWLKAIKDCGIDAVTLFNTYTAVAVDHEAMKFKLGNVYGGYSGPAIKPLVQRWVYDVSKKFNIDVIACGGVTSGGDVIEYLMLGAKAVQIGSGYFRNPNLPVECINFLLKYLRRKQISLQKLIGLLVK